MAPRARTLAVDLTSRQPLDFLELEPPEVPIGSGRRRGVALATGIGRGRENTADAPCHASEERPVARVMPEAGDVFSLATISEATASHNFFWASSFLGPLHPAKHEGAVPVRPERPLGHLTGAGRRVGSAQRRA